MHRCDLHVLEGVASSFDHGRSTATRQRLLTDRWCHAALSQPSFPLSPYPATQTAQTLHGRQRQPRISSAHVFPAFLPAERALSPKLRRSGYDVDLTIYC